MAVRELRGVVVGASTLLGKELADELSASLPVWDVRLTDAGEESGQLTSAGDEPVVIQALRPEIFEHADVAFFAGTQEETRTHRREAQKEGASILDLTTALENEPGVLVRSPWVSGGRAPDLTTVVVVPAHPAAVMLGVVAARLNASFGKVKLSATVLEPASQQGSAGLDEMHQQTVSLLGFHTLPQEVYDAQVAFNLQVRVGDDAKLKISSIEAMIRRHLDVIAGKAVGSSVAVQLVQAPVFHGYTMSVFVELPEKVDAAAVRKALAGSFVQIPDETEDAPSNQSVTESVEIQLSLREEPTSDGRGYWLWMAADNLRLAARHAMACATELAALRPTKDIQ